MDRGLKIRYSANSESFRFIPTKRTPKTKITCIINAVNLLGQKLAERKEVKLFVDQPVSLQLEIRRENEKKFHSDYCFVSQVFAFLR